MTTALRPVDRVTVIAGSVDFSGFTPFLAPLMSLNENLWPTMTLIMSRAAIFLMALVIFGWRRDA